MIYLTGHSGPEARAWHHDRFGVMIQPGSHYRHQIQHYPWYGVDTGCFAAGQEFSLDYYLGYLDVLPFRGRCLFATAPDVLGDADATWERSKDVLEAIRMKGYRAALVAQDGIDPERIRWAAFDVLFVGGTDAFKLATSTFALAREAAERGKWTHMGRVNSWPRFRKALWAGYGSCDGTLLRYGPATNLPRIQKWLERSEPRQVRV